MSEEMVPKETLPKLFVVSDGRGETCQHVLRAALVQFEGREFDLVVRPYVRTAEQVVDIVTEAARSHAVIFYTLVVHEVRVAITRLAEEHLVPLVDVLGPSFSALHDLLKSTRTAKPGLYYASDRERFDRQDAIDYTLNHDDGQRARELHLADVVLVGVSRASKSTTCFCLAFQGIKAANVPILPGLPGVAAAVQGQADEGHRAEHERRAPDDGARRAHGGPGHRAHALLRQQAGNHQRGHLCHEPDEEHHWRSIDASYMAVEEIAREVRRMIGL